MSYSIYGGGRNITLDELKAENDRGGMLLARAENSGSEGCYVEVAKWNESTERWERYAFEKYFGGEHPGDDDLATCMSTAEKYAAEINAAGYSCGENQSFIHALPNYGEGERAKQFLAAPELLESLEQILMQFSIRLNSCDPDEFELAAIEGARAAIATATA